MPDSFPFSNFLACGKPCVQTEKLAGDYDKEQRPTPRPERPLSRVRPLPVLLLQAKKVLVIVPARLSPSDSLPERVDVLPVPTWRVRLALLSITCGLTAVFGIAAWLNPYDAEGRALRSETHLQLGLPPCTFRALTGVPCPSCGMTTSFALLMHGDLRNSLRANAVGTLLAVFGLLLIPWSLASVLCSRPLFIEAFERALLAIVLIFVVLLFTRWIVVVSLTWWSR